MVTIEFEKNNCRAVAYDGEREIGICNFKENDGRWTITHTEVLPGYKGSGIAKKLVLCVIARAEECGIDLAATCLFARYVLET